MPLKAISVRLDDETLTRVRQIAEARESPGTISLQLINGLKMDWRHLNRKWRKGLAMQCRKRMSRR
ncbi:MAG: putative transcriptional regulator [Candidatus Azotimanducaceae bacterium]|jgi:predicted transcriptional regulator